MPLSYPQLAVVPLSTVPLAPDCLNAAMVLLYESDQAGVLIPTRDSNSKRAKNCFATAETGRVRCNTKRAAGDLSPYRLIPS